MVMTFNRKVDISYIILMKIDVLFFLILSRKLVFLFKLIGSEFNS